MDVEHDEWFTRGWTLQELLASKRIKFFYKHWTPLMEDEDDKNMEPTEVMETLERATHIPFDDLFFTPDPIRVDKRITWAARCKTTRAEDVAYSLMGMFDVSLQLEGPVCRTLHFTRYFSISPKLRELSIFGVRC
jgi:hypothetical protein